MYTEQTDTPVLLHHVSTAAQNNKLRTKHVPYILYILYILLWVCASSQPEMVKKKKTQNVVGTREGLKAAFILALPFSGGKQHQPLLLSERDG